jgi:hypothetical protein
MPVDHYVARIAGRRQSVHRLLNDVDLMGRCHQDEASFTGNITASEFAKITKDDPRRLCGHCYPTVDR